MLHDDLIQEVEKQKGLNCIYTNTDCLHNKLEELETFVHDNNIYIIAINEFLPKNTVNEDHIENDERFYLPGFKYIENPKNRGVCLFIKNKLINNSTRLPEYENIFSPSIFYKFNLSKKDHFIFGVVYRSPNCTEPDNDKINELIKIIVKEHSFPKENIVICGDFNYPDIDWATENSKHELNHKSSKFLSTIHECFLTQHVNDPTHYRALQTPTLIDLILSNNPELINELKFYPPFGNSHHQVVFFKIDIIPPPVDMNKYQTPKYQINKGNYDNMRKYLGEINWFSAMNRENETVDSCWNFIADKIHCAKELYIPKKKVKQFTCRRSFAATPSFLNLVRQKRAAFKHYKKYRTQENLDFYHTLRDRVNVDRKDIKIAKETTVASEAKNNPKAFYQYLSSKSKPKENIGKLENDKGELTDEDEEKTEILNNFFASVFSKEDVENVPDFDFNSNVNISSVSITKEDMYKALKSLKINKSPGPDEIHPRILSECAEELSYPLTTLFTLTMSSGVLPQAWKVAEVRPIFKKGNKSTPGNYRPVSLTSVICKVFESFVRDAIYNHFTSNGFLSNKQFGFCKGRSCVSQLLVTLHSWFLSNDNKMPVDALYLDFQKAFDTVPHKRLMNKLKGYGISSNLFNWINDFLTNRTQRVCINDKFSNTVPVTSGVPQGSVLGPVLFIYYINDLPEAINSDLKIFADDTKTFSEIKTTEDRDALQNDLDLLVEWSEKWLLKFNSKKCKVLHIGKNNPKYKYYIRDGNQINELEETLCEKDLGVHVDNNLKFEEHIVLTVKKARRISGMINRAIFYKIPKIMLPLYKALVRSVIEYANTVWNPYLKKYINLIESVQRNFTKLIHGTQSLSYEKRLKNLKLPSLEYRRLRGDLIECFKIIHHKYDPLTTDKLLTLTSNSITRTNSLKITKPRFNSDQLKNFFINRVVNLWNKLPYYVVNASSLNNFKNKIDKILKPFMYSININTDAIIRQINLEIKKSKRKLGL